jgi:hypothetical protein
MSSTIFFYSAEAEREGFGVWSCDVFTDLEGMKGSAWHIRYTNKETHSAEKGGDPKKYQIGWPDAYVVTIGLMRPGTSAVVDKKCKHEDELEAFASLMMVPVSKTCAAFICDRMGKCLEERRGFHKYPL